MGVNPFDSAALGRLIERVVDLGFLIKEKRMSPLYRVNQTRNIILIISIKTGVPFS